MERECKACSLQQAKQRPVLIVLLGLKRVYKGGYKEREGKVEG